MTSLPTEERRERIVAGLAAALRDPECPVQFSPLLMEARNMLAARASAPAGADGWEATALKAMDAEITRLRTALRIIAGREQCIDNCLGNVDVACLALDKAWPGPSAIVADKCKDDAQ